MLQRRIASEHTSHIKVHQLYDGFDCGRPIVGSDEGNSTTFETETSNAHVPLSGRRSGEAVVGCMLTLDRLLLFYRRCYSPANLEKAMKKSWDL